MRMSIVFPLVASSVLMVSAASAEGTVDAAEAVSAHPVSVAGLLGYGINNISAGGTDSFNIYGFGIGARGGYTLPFNLYVGGLAQYNFGSSYNFPSPLGGSVSLSGRIFMIGPEVGYDFAVQQFTVRPYMGLGLGFAGGDLKFNDSTTKASIWPGVQGVYNITEQAFAGLDLRYTILFADTGEGGGSPNSFGFYGTGGYRF